MWCQGKVVGIIRESKDNDVFVLLCQEGRTCKRGENS